jgi:hypothetical protein
VLDRLKERHLGLEKLAAEVSKVEGLTVNADNLAEILKKNPCLGVYLLAAAKMDDDYKKNLLPTDYDDWATVSKCFGTSVPTKHECKKLEDYDAVNLPPFLKHALIKIVKTTQSER